MTSEILRPQTSADFIGQKRIVDTLRMRILAAQMRGETLDTCCSAGRRERARRRWRTLSQQRWGRS